ncbi:MAG: UDP-glucose 4-epimerase GalE [Gammaproteobacteria bacterium]|nr:MAG: UDP-glucose 4-epimerase GalE [Gammaproteobacteria bacterium]
MTHPVLVTGGAGYIGSHVVKLLGRAGREVVVLDNLSRGFREAVTHGELVVGDTGDRELVLDLLRERGIGSVLHFAAHTVVPESVERPLKYYGNNTCCTRNLLECCAEAGVRHFVFSSTAAVYGVPERGAEGITEQTPTSPINPYGSSKLMSEWMLRDLAAATALRHVTLRYFNVAGCDPEGEIGQSTPDATLLIKVCAEVAAGRREALKIYGTDYPTPDGTGVRDYIHVTDLADAHLRALDHLEGGGESVTLNCGYGHGYSVREVVASVERVLGRPIPVVETGRRPGDPPALVADSSRLKALFGWQPRYDDLDTIVRTALDWERNRRY